MRNVSDRSCTESQKKCFYWITLFPNIVPLLDNVKNRGTGGQAGNDNIIRRMCFTYWMNKITNTHPEYVTLLCLSMAAMVTRPQLSVKFIIHCFCLFVLLLAVRSVDQSGRKAINEKNIFLPAECAYMSTGKCFSTRGEDLSALKAAVCNANRLSHF